MKKLSSGIVRVFIIVSIAALVIIGSFMVSSRVTAAGAAKEPAEKFYTSVRINSGDTLWSVAEQYCDTDRVTIRDYIDDLKEMNGIVNDRALRVGEYIAVYYFG